MSEESDGQLLQRLGSNGQLWAREFMSRSGARRDDIDEGLMIGWFANAIEAGRDAGRAGVDPVGASQVTP